MNFKESKTKENLMRAFAGESQARNRYTFAASVAKKNNLYVIESVFNYTAGQEKEHAEVFYNLLSECAGETIEIDGTYPVDIDNNVAGLLKSAVHNEMEEYEDVYKSFANTARDEGFENIAIKFEMIAEIEKTHAERFKKFLTLLENDKLFLDETKTKWICLNCGHISETKGAPEICPVCDHNKGYFIRHGQSPYES